MIQLDKNAHNPPALDCLPGEDGSDFLLYGFDRGVWIVDNILI